MPSFLAIAAGPNSALSRLICAASVRQREGIATAMAAGMYKGRPVSIDAAQIRQLRATLP